MPIATVTAQFVNQPKEGKRFGSIKTEIGYIGVKPSDLSQFVKGQKYEVEYKENGEYKDFVRIVSAPAASAGHNRPNANGANTGREIFITGVVGRAMGSGKFGLDEIGLVTAKASAAWDDHVVPKKDESPY